MIDLLKFDKPKQFPKDEILNEKDRMVRSWMSVEVKDRQGDIVPMSELKKVMNTWFKRGATMMDHHTNRPIGRGLSWQETEHPGTNQPGIILDYQVFDDYSVDDQVWDEIKSQKRTGLSIGGRATGGSEIKEDAYSKEKGKALKGVELYEVSPVDKAANKFAETLAINYLAKGMSPEDEKEYEEKLLMDIQKGFSGEVKKPFAGFENFDACTIAQKERGHSTDSAERICGYLKHRTEKNWTKAKEVGDNAELKKADGDEFKPGDNVIYGPLDDHKYMKAKVLSEPSKGGVKIKLIDTGEEMDTDMDNVNPPGRLNYDYKIKEKIPGGLSEGKKPENLDQRALAEGIKVEMEHTDDSKVAQEIAMDHLTEDPEYYKKLMQVEKMGEKIVKGYPNEFVKEITKARVCLKSEEKPQQIKNKSWPSSFKKSCKNKGKGQG